MREVLGWNLTAGIEKLFISRVKSSAIHNLGTSCNVHVHSALYPQRDGENYYLQCSFRAE